MSQKTAQRINSRNNILSAAAKLFRKNGYAATGVDAVMGEAGLTAGAFYNHFPSKQKLLEESLKLAGAKVFDELAKANSKEAPKILKQAVAMYLSDKHRDHPEGGCPVASLCNEIFRSPRRVRGVLREHVTGWAELLRKGLSKPSRNESLLLIATLMGTIQLSRVLDDEEMSDEFLEYSKKRLNEIFQGE